MFTAAQSMKLLQLIARLLRVDERGWQLKGGDSNAEIKHTKTHNDICASIRK